MSVKLVTDSTCDLPKELAERWNITVVPCNVHFGDEVYKDGIDIDRDEFYRRLVSSTVLPTTAQPSVNDFLEVYGPLREGGYDVVSIHISAKLSGTLNSAELASAELAKHASPQSESTQGGGIRILDSEMTSMGLGLIALEAAQMVTDGASSEHVAGHVQNALPMTHCYFLLDTLEYLRKGGRIGKARALLGSVLKIKPILTIKEGEAHPAERVRTREQGLRKLEEVVRRSGPIKRLSIVHSTTPDEAEMLRQRLGDVVAQEDTILAGFGPVMGTYLGPGALGVSFMRSS